MMFSYTLRQNRQSIYVDLDRSERLMSKKDLARQQHQHLQPGQRSCHWRLAPQSVNRSLEDDEAARSSGIVIDTNGLIAATGYGIICKSLSYLDTRSSTVIWYGYTKSLVQHQRQGIAVIKSGGVVECDTAFMRQIRNQKIREYFYGTTKLELAP
ncbi:hypothetical protein BGZ65_005176 [Modicella reniformis]|uniref:Polynucleotide 5'-hydroxyl-kinase GRC3 n=1 Tax=Modicella reniformis TaxID=1440133 RepID=A0A9P6IXL6_9FUNG|nr:hypothetical protein BGZ65_005176 [Modicella reniformis]